MANKTHDVPLEQRQREAFFALIGKHLPRLYEIVRAELDAARSAGDVAEKELTSEDVVDEIMLQAYREFAKHPDERRMSGRLMKLAKERVKSEIGRLRSGHRETIHKEQDIPETPPEEYVSTLGDEVLDFYEPDEDLKLEDIIPDLSIPTPEQDAERDELRLCVSMALSGLPRLWRRALFLSLERELDNAEVARVMGRPQGEIERVLMYARQYLRQRLVEAGCDLKSDD